MIETVRVGVVFRRSNRCGGRQRFLVGRDNATLPAADVARGARLAFDAGVGWLVRLWEVAASGGRSDALRVQVQ